MRQGMVATIVAVVVSFNLGISSEFAKSDEVWNMATAWGGGPFLEEDAKGFAQLVNRLTDGRIQINVFPGGTLGNPLKVSDTVRSGAVQAGHSWMGYDWGIDKTTLVFGGGHVVLPLLQAGVVEPRWVNNDTFLAGYGLTQAVPGPLFTLSAFLGTMLDINNSGQIAGVVGGIICVIAIFLPSFLLVLGIMLYWVNCRELPWVYRSLKGVNAAVAGLLLAAFMTPVVEQSILNYYDLCWALLGYYLLSVHKLPPWLIILGAMSLGYWL